MRFHRGGIEQEQIEPNRQFIDTKGNIYYGTDVVLVNEIPKPEFVTKESYIRAQNPNELVKVDEIIK